jgi:hypothetical protein
MNKTLLSIGAPTTLIFLLMLPFMSLMSCSQGKASLQHIADSEGLQNFHTSGYSWFSCSEDDTFSTGFTATKNGKPVRGVMCGGWFKGTTIRYF